MTPKILSFGEIIWDIYSDRRIIGGATLNFAAHCAKCGADSFLISAVGNDALGKDAAEIIRKSQVGMQYLQTVGKPTGQCAVTLNKAGVPSFRISENTAFDNIVLSDADIASVQAQNFDALYFGTLIQRNKASEYALKKLCGSVAFAEIVCDINLRENCYSAASARFCLEKATALKLSDEEEPLLGKLNLYKAKDGSPEEVSKAVCAEFPQIKYFIMTRGARGAYVYDSRERKGFFAAPESTVVASTVGAGDSFIAAWCTLFLSGRPISEATEKAIKLSSYVVSRTEAVPPYRFINGKFTAEE